MLGVRDPVDVDVDPLAAVVAVPLERQALRIVGVMLESFLLAGNQKLGGELTYGQSVTDECMDWETTVEVLRGLDSASRSRRERA